MKKPIAVAVLVGFSLPCSGHDLWLVPPSSANGARAVVVDVSQGMDFPASEGGMDPSRALDTTVLAVGGKRLTARLEQADDKSRTTLSFEGRPASSYLVGLSTQPKVLELQAAKFNDYLLHDGLGHVLAQRMDAGELDQDAVERYRKSVKALIRTDGAARDDTLASTRLGQRLEIVPERDPCDIAPDAAFWVRVWFEDAPLVGANVCWDHPGNGERFTGQTWTNSEGRALVPVDRMGLMTIRLVHMTRPVGEEHGWESYWSSLTFVINPSE